MDIQARKLNFVREFLRITDEELVARLESLLQTERRRSLEKEPVPMTIDDLEKIVSESESDFMSGRETDAKELLKLIDTWK
jgi:hypothetical protein